jgi:CBS domain-containing protein
MRVQDVMTRRVETILPEESVDAARRKMRTARIRHLVVMHGRKLVGVISDRDLGLELGERVEDVMTRHAVSATSDMTVRKAANLLRGRTVGCLPVLESGKLVGIVTTTDLLEHIGRGAVGPVARGRRWTLKGRGPRRKSVVGHRGFAAH